MNDTCENCGLPAGALSDLGVFITIVDNAENNFQRPRKRTVWCHNRECAFQSLAISKYGPASFRWPISLAQFRAMTRLEDYQPGTAKPRTKRVRASKKAKQLVWTLPTAENALSTPL
jgi:hypothetical protein